MKHDGMVEIQKKNNCDSGFRMVFYRCLTNYIKSNNHRHSTGDGDEIKRQSIVSTPFFNTVRMYFNVHKTELP